MLAKKRIAITMGDPNGIGPEVIVKALSSPAIRSRCNPIVIGNAAIMEKAVGRLGASLRIRTIASPDESSRQKGMIELVEPGDSIFDKSGSERVDEGIPRWEPAARPTAEGGRLSFSFIGKAVQLALSGHVDAVVTAPISKEALKMAGLKWPGHTEMLSELTKTRDYAMVLAGGPLKVILVTIHMALKNVAGSITAGKVLSTIRLARKTCEMFSIRTPRIAVAGLNPHAGENGIFGDEERNIIVPAIRKAAREGITVSGPYPPDTVFHKAYKGEIDIVVCMYHDQGLIPLKMIAFDTGVNITVGLPFVRTSPDHGTAYDIAWKGLASPSSLIEAITLAAKLKA